MSSNRPKRYRLWRDGMSEIPKQTLSRWRKDDQQPTSLSQHEEHSDGFSGGVTDGTVATGNVTSEAEDAILEISEVYSSHDSSSDDEEISILEEEEMCRNPEMREPLEPIYPSAKIAAKHSRDMLLHMACKHSLTGAALNDVLRIIRAHLPQDAPTPENLLSVFKLKNSSLADEDLITRYYYCSKCQHYGKEKCPDVACTKQEAFLHLSVASQLKKILQSDQTLCSKLVLQEGENLFSNERLFRLTISLSTDGVQLFKSSSKSLWPVWCRINELPFKLKFYLKYKILCAVWVGKGKPSPLWLLKPVVKELNTIFLEGFDVDLRGERWRCRVRCSCFIADLPARATVLSQTHFNGKFPCSFCEAEGVVVAKGSGHARVFPPEQSFISRTHNLFLKYAKDSLEKKAFVKGVNGISPLFALKGFNIVENVAIDYMHNILEGVVKRLLSLWFDFSDNIYCISKFINVIDQRLSRIKPPEIVTRLPSALGRRSYWKASECRSWLLYYSLPVLRDILPDHLWWHHSLLVGALHHYLSHSLTEAQEGEAGVMISKYCIRYEHYYGKQNCTMNYHLLRHISDDVSRFGPLWTHSAFEFESVSGKLQRLVHGKHDIAVEVSSAWQSMQSVYFEDDDGEFNPISKSYCRNKRYSLGRDIYGLGSPDRLEQYAERLKLESSALQRFFGSDVGRLLFFKRIYHPALGVIHCKSYVKPTKRNNYTVTLEMDGAVTYAEANAFVAAEAASGEIDTFILYKAFATSDPFFNPDESYQETYSHLESLNKIIQSVALPSNELELSTLNSLVGRLVYLEMDDNEYVVTLPNYYERD